MAENVIVFPGASLSDRPDIQVSAGDIHRTATEAEDALLDASAPFYVRGGIVRPVVDDLPATRGCRTKVARLVEVDCNTMIDYFSRCANWLKFDGRKKALARINPPKDVALTLLSRDGEWRFPKLTGVITTPTLRPDGTILSQPGYDEQTHLLLLSPPEMPEIPEKLSKGDAARALTALDSLLDEFPFVDEVSRSVALSALITPVARGAMQTAPMHAFSAPSPGSGKSFLGDLVGAITIGSRTPVLSVDKKAEETEKRLTGALISGMPLIAIDNVNGELGGDLLCQMIERPIVSVRALGSSELVSIESRACVFATGNNIRLVGDMTRRVVLCRLDPNMERPELRQFKKSPFDLILSDRGRFVAAALTVVRAYAQAGYPGQLPSLASFEDWSRIVRSALVWLDQPDPVLSMEQAREDDPETTALRTVLIGMKDAMGVGWRSSAEIKALAEERMFDSLSRPDFNQAIRSVAENRRGDIDALRIGHFLTKFKGRVVGGLKLRSQDNTHSKVKIWSVQEV